MLAVNGSKRDISPNSEVCIFPVLKEVRLGVSMEVFASSSAYAATQKASNVSLVKTSAPANNITPTMRMKSMLLDYTLTDRKNIPPLWETADKPSMQPVGSKDSLSMSSSAQTVRLAAIHICP